MPLPGDVVTITVTGHFNDMQGNPQSGTVTFTPTTGPFADATSEVIFEPNTVTATMNDAGEISEVLPCTSNSDFAPSAWAWMVTERPDSGVTRAYFIELPASLGSTVDLSQLAQVEPPSDYQGYLPLTAGAGAPLSGTLYLDGATPLALPSGTDDYVLTSDADGNITLQPPTGGGSGSPTGAASGDLSGDYPGPTVVSTHLALALPVDQGGTGSETQNFVDLTTNQTAAGVKTFTGEVIVPAPVNSTDAATKAYVDASSQGLSVKDSVQEATAAALPSYTYSNGTMGNGATLTATATGVLTVDGVAVALNDRVLVQNETGGNAPYNGLYLCTTAGASGVAYVLTRTIDQNSAAQFPGAFTFVEKGTDNANAGFVCTTPPTVTVGTTAIEWTQFSAAGSYEAGTGLTLSGNTFSLTHPVTIADGGTGQGSQQAALNALAGTVTSAQFLRGNGTNVQMQPIQASDVPTLNQNTAGTAAGLSSTLAVGSGGTGATSFTANAPLAGNGASAVEPITTGLSSSGYVLTSNGTGTLPSFQAPAGGLSNPMTTSGDMLYENASPAPARLPGNTTATKNFLTMTSAVPGWGTLASGDIPANAANTSGTAANLSGTPALPNGTTATTQTGTDNTAKLATTAFVQTVASAAEAAAEAASDPAGTASGLLGSLYAGPVFIPTSGVPSSGSGINGDYALDPIAEIVYGPKASGSWPTGTALSLPTYAGAPLTSGEATFLRETLSASATLTSGTLLLSYWTAVKSESSVAVTVLSNATASSGLTYAAIGLYSVNTSTLALTLVASTPSTTTLCNSMYTLYKTDFSAPYSRTAGQEYAIGVLMVGSTMPSLTSAPGDTNANAIPPRVSGALSGQSSLPSSISDASLAATYLRFFATVTPS